MLACKHSKKQGPTVIDLPANRERVVAQLPGDVTIVVSETAAFPVLDLSFEEQQDALFEILQSFENID